MKVYNRPARTDWPTLLRRPALEVGRLDALVNDVLTQVAERGDAALLDYTAKFDKVELEAIRVTDAEIRAAKTQVPAELKAAIRTAHDNIRRFHAAQAVEPQVIETMPGVRCWRKSVAIQRVGLYVPGGTAPLFSTVLMLGVPAVLAGCAEIVLCTPPQRDGSIHPATLYTADLIGITTICKMGGAQAVAAMAQGTASVPQVDKIFGPGNQYVTAAKQLVSRRGTAIDMPAGPSEVLVYMDATAHPNYVAVDLLSQAEHGADSQVVLVAETEDQVREVLLAIELHLADLPRAAAARAALDNSVAFVLSDRNEAVDLVNAYAPEHLILSLDDAPAVADRIVNAGSVFLGHLTPESVGDYASGTNHTLPTNGFARAYSGVSLDSFVKKITYQQLTAEGLRHVGPPTELMAAAEGLEAHRRAVAVRLKRLASDRAAASRSVVED